MFLPVSVERPIRVSRLSVAGETSSSDKLLESDILKTVSGFRFPGFPGFQVSRFPCWSQTVFQDRPNKVGVLLLAGRRRRFLSCCGSTALGFV